MKKMYIDNGYWMIWLPNNKRTQLHRWLMEQKIGRKLDINEVVHHKNGVKTDNRIENLELISREGHSSLHAKRKTFEEMYEKRNCAFCGKEFNLLKRLLRKKNRKTPYIYCSRSCGTKAQWQRGKIPGIGKRK